MTDTKEIKEGHIYIIFNEVFNYYGDNVFKLGKAMDIEKRLSGYTTSYIDNTEVKFLSELCSDYSLAELIIFDRLKSSRIKQNREFFRGDLQEFIKEIEDVVKKVNDKSITAREKQQKKRQTIQLNDLQKTQSLAYAHEIVNLLGFTSFNDTSLIKHDSFQSNTKKVMTYLMEKHKSDSKQFNAIMYKTKHKISKIEGSSVRATIGYINSFLSTHCLKISAVQKQEGSYINKTNYYKLQLVAPDHDIDNVESIDIDDVGNDE